MTDDAFERKVSEARDSAARVFRRAVREAEIAQQREERRARTALGGSIDDLHALIGSGFRAGVIAIDPPWPFATYSERARGAVTDHYERPWRLIRLRRSRYGSSRPTTARSSFG